MTSDQVSLEGNKMAQDAKVLLPGQKPDGGGGGGGGRGPAEAAAAAAARGARADGGGGRARGGAVPAAVRQRPGQSRSAVPEG